MMRAVEKYDVNVVGLTLSKNQANHVQQLVANSENLRSKRVLLAGWEQFDEPVDRIVSIGAFEHFGHERYDAFFSLAHRLLPADGVMLLHTITGLHPKEIHERGLPMSFTFARFLKFIVTEIFPGGRLPSIPMVQECASANGFTVTRVQSLQPHYAKTLDLWSAALQANKGQAIALQSEEVYERYMKYLTAAPRCFASDTSTSTSSPARSDYQCTPGTSRPKRLSGLGTPARADRRGRRGAGGRSASGREIPCAAAESG